MNSSSTTATTTCFQIFSDIHLTEIEENTIEGEFIFDFEKAFPKVSKKCEILFLAGDIGQLTSPIYEKFFDYVSSNWKFVFYVLGNNEYYISKKLQISHNQVLKLYKDFFKSKYPNVHLLENEMIYLPIDDGSKTLRIMGCTLWSHATSEQAKKYTHTFQKILDKDLNPISIQEYNSLNEISTKWILKNLDKPPNNGGAYFTVVLTHYPTFQKGSSHPQHEKDQNTEQKNLFANDFLKFSSHPHIHFPKDLIFISGHTHYSFTLIQNDSYYLSNQYGHHVIREEETLFDPKKLYHIL